MNREPRWLYAADDEPQPEDGRYAIARGWFKRAPRQEPERQRQGGTS
jgi:hypothetical protein